MQRFVGLIRSLTLIEKAIDMGGPFDKSIGSDERSGRAPYDALDALRDLPADEDRGTKQTFLGLVERSKSTLGLVGCTFAVIATAAVTAWLVVVELPTTSPIAIDSHPSECAGPSRHAAEIDARTDDSREPPSGWRMLVADRHSVLIQSPRNLCGPMEVELRPADTGGSPRKPPVVESAVSRSEPAEMPTDVVRQLDHDEIALLLRRGAEFIAAGDFASARLVLRRAAEGGDATAAMNLGKSYDPIVFEERGVRGLVADVDIARTWYERAKNGGSAEAPRRLELLANRRN